MPNIAISTFTKFLSSETPELFIQFSVALCQLRPYGLLLIVISITTVRDGEPGTATSTFTQLASY